MEEWFAKCPCGGQEEGWHWGRGEDKLRGELGSGWASLGLGVLARQVQARPLCVCLSYN